MGWVTRVRQTSRVRQLDDEVLELDELLALLLSHVLRLTCCDGISILLWLLLLQVVRLIGPIPDIIPCSPRTGLLARLRAVHVLVRLVCVPLLGSSFTDSRLIGLLGWRYGSSPRLLHLLDRLAIVVNDVTLVCEVRIEESSKDHYLVVTYGNATELGPLLILELAIQVDEFPRRLLHVVGLREVDPLDGA